VSRWDSVQAVSAADTGKTSEKVSTGWGV